MSQNSSAQLFVAVFCLIQFCWSQRDVLFQGATAATWNDTSQALRVYRGASLLVHGDQIGQIYKASDKVDKGDAEITDATHKTIAPGFVRTHHYVWQTLCKTLIPNLPFAAHLPRLGHMAPISETLGAEEVYRSELIGRLELLNEGMTT